MRRRTIAGMILTAELLLAAYLMLVVWLLSVWMVDDSQAFRMVPSDWYVTGARRLCGGLLVGMAFGGLTFAVNRKWVLPFLSESPWLGTRTTLLVALGIVLSATAGTIQFVITKPFM
jgi:hypothetical protein